MEEVLKCEKVSQVRGATVGSDFAARRADAPGEPLPSSRILIHMPRKDELCSCMNVVNVYECGSDPEQYVAVALRH